jgi:hypothetical protein
MSDEVEGLTLPQLAAAAGLPLATTAEYCDTFADHLLRVGPERWAPINAALLQIIHGLAESGRTTEAIGQELDGAAPQPTPSPYDTDAITERLTEIRAVVKQQPLPSEKTPEQSVWWRFWQR